MALVDIIKQVIKQSSSEVVQSKKQKIIYLRLLKTLLLIQAPHQIA